MVPEPYWPQLWRHQRSYLPKSTPVDQTTRWRMTLSSKVNLPHVIIFQALCGKKMVTYHPRYWGQRNPRTPPSSEGPGDSGCITLWGRRPLMLGTIKRRSRDQEKDRSAALQAVDGHDQPGVALVAASASFGFTHESQVGQSARYTQNELGCRVPKQDTKKTEKQNCVRICWEQSNPEGPTWGRW